jgi:hypothetical protein
MTPKDLWAFLSLVIMGALILLMMVLGAVKRAHSHDLTPTYAEMKQAHSSNIYAVELSTWNNRDDIEYYEIEVWDEEWKPIPFATIDKIFRVAYQTRKNLKVFIRKKDKDRVVYICTLSKMRKYKVTRTVVASRVCSKIKR